MERPRTGEDRDGVPPVDPLAGEPAPADEDPIGPEPRVPPGRVEPVVIPRWMQAVGLTVTLLGLSALGRASRPVLVLFIVASVIALILNPLVKLLQRAGLPRGAAIAVVLLGFFAAVAGSVTLLVNPVSDQIRALQRDLPALIDNANVFLPACSSGWTAAGWESRSPGGARRRWRRCGATCCGARATSCPSPATWSR